LRVADLGRDGGMLYVLAHPPPNITNDQGQPNPTSTRTNIPTPREVAQVFGVHTNGRPMSKKNAACLPHPSRQPPLPPHARPTGSRG
jgi:hypothetical protein